jgi:hypothetical protein
LDTIPNEIHNQIFDFELLASSTQAAIRLAQHEAIKMDAPEVYPEHLFLGILRQDDIEVTLVLKEIGLDRQKMLAQVTDIFGNLNSEGIQPNLLFSRESLACFEWALAFATQMNSSLIFSKHLMLSVLRHPRIKPLLILLLPSRDQDVLPAPLVEAEGHAYTSYIDQLIHSRVREQSITKFKDSSLNRVFRWFERPHTTFVDIQGLDGAKEKLQEVVDFLRKPQNFQQSKRTYLYGTLLVGHPCTDRTLLVKATAGEAVVPLVCLSLSSLIKVLTDLNSGVISLDDLDLPMDEHELLINNDHSQRGQKMIAHIFSQAKQLSPCVLFFDNLDAVNPLLTSPEREQWLKQLAIEMDGPDNHPPMAVIASTNQIYKLDQALLHPGRFEHRVVMSSSLMTHPSAPTKLCLACKNEVLVTWKYCVYCGASIAQTCPNCGTLLMQLEGARFCSECGTSQRNTQDV